MKKNILIVDDDKSILSIFEFILNKKQYNCITSDNYSKALNLFNENSVDLVFIDARLKEDSGLDLFADLKKSVPGMPIILMTGYKTEEIVSEMYEIGSNLIIYKPFDVEEILKLIKLTIK